MSDAPGTCYGFEVRSSLALRFLRDGASGVPLVVREDERAGDEGAELVAEWNRRPGHDLHARLYANGGGFDFWTDREGWFHIDPGAPLVTVPHALDEIRLEERLWGIPAALCYMHRGDFAVHASAVAVGGGALLFGAPGRFGKTTLAAAFLRAGHGVLSEDFTCCRIDPGPQLLPGPALLRMRRDVYGTFDVPDTVPIAEDPDKVHLSIDAARRGDGHPVPLRGIIFLRTGEEDLAAERLTVEDALPDLWTLTFKLPTDDGWARSFRAVTALAASVPLWNITRPLRFDRLDDTVEFVVSTCLGTARETV